LDVSLNIRKAARMPPKGRSGKKIGADKIENEGGDVPLEANGDTAPLPKKKRTKGSDGSLEADCDSEPPPKKKQKKDEVTCDSESAPSTAKKKKKVHCLQKSAIQRPMLQIRTALVQSTQKLTKVQLALWVAQSLLMEFHTPGL